MISITVVLPRFCYELRALVASSSTRVMPTGGVALTFLGKRSAVL